MSCWLSLGGIKRTRTLRQKTNRQHLWPWKYISISLLVIFVAVIVALEYQVQTQRKLDALEAEKLCIQEKHEAKEKCRSDMDQVKEEWRLNVDELKGNFRSEMEQVKETCRLDVYRANEQYKNEKNKRVTDIENEGRLWAEAIRWLIECLTGKHLSQHGNMFSTIFNALWRAIKTGIGMNRDIEDCIEQFEDRYQNRLRV